MRHLLRGAYFHEFDDEHVHFHDHHGDDGGGGEEDDGVPLTWALDNVELLTVGVDVGSSTSHLLFARLHLQRLMQSLSSRFAVVKREVLHRSPILLTPYRTDGLIDVEALDRFMDEAYREAGFDHDQVDTGAVILTGAALERVNSRAVAELFARSGGRFVCASAGHNLEAILAAHGSGAAALSHRRGDTLLHMDIGGGTAKLALVRDGDILQTAAVHVGGRLVAVDDQERVTRIEPSAALLAERLGIPLAMGERLPAEARARLADALVEVLLAAAHGAGGPAPLAAAADGPGGGLDAAALAEVTREFMLTDSLHFEGGARPDAITFSGGVSEYIYEREERSFGDLAQDLARSLRRAMDAGRLPAPATALGEGIRATVIGASQYSVQLSGNTVHISNPSVLPLRNLPVVFTRLPESGDLHEGGVADAIGQGFRRLDLVEGDAPVALALPWKGEPYYRTLRALAGGIAKALPASLRAGFPLVLALDGDVGRSLGGILEEEFGVRADIVSIDGLQLMELDYVDVGEVILPANVVPVVVKSLAFPGAGHAAPAGGPAPARAKAQAAV